MINETITIQECVKIICPGCYACRTCLGWGIVLGIAVAICIIYFTEAKEGVGKQ